MKIDIGFGKVLSVRLLRASPERRARHIFKPKVEVRSALMERHNEAVELLERRRTMRSEGADTQAIEKRIAGLGYAWEDELSRDDFAYSYWRRK